ncbi:MAG TPA: DNA repair protein RecN [Sandaracinaceae bacterium LLY-WYZ-13_1]|nr:DNA repair protein RecN [Sandaracinaceae bacterium LLY-WYZ-13_1]
MLTCLRVRDLAIIDRLEVELGPGLNVITGETGAGKSILIDALGLVLGEKGRPELVRTGAKQAEVEALFDVGDDPEALDRLEASGLEREPELIVRRVVRANGRTRAYLNGRLASAGQLAELVAGLVDISSQHEHHTLVDPSTHLSFLDAFGALESLRDHVRDAHRGLREADEALREAENAVAQRGEREDLLRFQIREIDELDPQPGEGDELGDERERLRHAERLAAAAGGAEDALYARDGALCEQLGRIAQDLRDAAAIDAALTPMAEALESATTQIEEAARELGAYARDVTLDPERLAELEERLHRLKRLMRKYGGDVEGVLTFREEARAELEGLDRTEERIGALERARTKALAKAADAARKLSERRRGIAEDLGDRIGEELGSLGMGGARVEVQVEPLEDKRGSLSVDGARLTETGIDRVEFLIAPNKGEVPRPLRKIASGGELSRAMLAIKRVLAGVGRAGLYVFDEVDSGVGGAVAEVIGRKLVDVAAHHQVICITHLAQIAVYADRHYRVVKRVEGERTKSTIERLDEAEQLEEIARMVGGLKITKSTRKAAAEMLEVARAAR